MKSSVFVIILHLPIWKFKEYCQMNLDDTRVIFHTSSTYMYNSLYHILYMIQSVLWYYLSRA